ncbi:MAG: hypothetical protein Q4C82_05915 [Eubacteriales bacterium]|nr:hypothetical protein [Eubacteriales bacterium]
MPWCPICKNEYIKGKTRCPDCDAGLVEELPPETPQDARASDGQATLSAEEKADIEARKAAAAHMSTYASARTRHSEAKSSAWTFLLVGSAGFLVITLALIGLIRLPFGVFSLAVLEGLFLLFLVVAGLSFKHAVKMLDDISKEDSLETRIRSWAADNLRAEELTRDLDQGTSEELRYFIVSEMIRERIMRAFPEVDDPYAEELTERFYNELFQ